MRRATFVLAILLAGWTAAAAAAPCAGFTDVEHTDPFCANVAWMKNRGVTRGCETTLYCPHDPVSRIVMAGFISRLDRVLGPTVVDAQGNAVGPLVTFTGTIGQAYYRTDGAAYSILLLNAAPNTSPPVYSWSNDFVFYSLPNCTGATYMSTTLLVSIVGKLGLVVRGPGGSRLLFTTASYPPASGTFPSQSYLHDGACTNFAQSFDGYVVTLVENLAAKYTEPLTVN